RQIEARAGDQTLRGRPIEEHDVRAIHQTALRVAETTEQELRSLAPVEHVRLQGLAEVARAATNIQNSTRAGGYTRQHRRIDRTIRQGALHDEWRPSHLLRASWTLRASK